VLRVDGAIGYARLSELKPQRTPEPAIVGGDDTQVLALNRQAYRAPSPDRRAKHPHRVMTALGCSYSRPHWPTGRELFLRRVEGASQSAVAPAAIQVRMSAISSSLGFVPASGIAVHWVALQSMPSKFTLTLR